MGQASQLLGHNHDTEVYLSKAVKAKDKHSMYFYQASQTIINEMPSLKD